MVHRRQIEGNDVVFGNQGALWGNAMTWFDYDTGSIWSQPIGEAIAGPHKGKTLELLPTNLTHWATWQTTHPGTLALDAPGGNARFDLEDMAIVVELGDDVAAFLVTDLRATGPANDVVAGAAIAVVVDPTDEQRWEVYSRVLDDVVVELAVDGNLFVDTITGSHFDPIVGRAVDGPLAGQVLDRLPGFTSFPRDYRTFWPDGRFYDPATAR
jgi:hypothetical protein